MNKSTYGDPSAHCLYLDNVLLPQLNGTPFPSGVTILLIVDCWASHIEENNKRFAGEYSGSVLYISTRE